MSDRMKMIIVSVLIIGAVVLTIIPAYLQTRRFYPVFTGVDRSFQMPVSERLTGTISMNSDDVNELCQLNGVGETLAEMIISEREANGLFFYPEDLTGVKGIGIKKMHQIRDDLDY